MPQLLDLPNELLRAIADAICDLPRGTPPPRVHCIASFRLTNRRLSEVGKFVFRNFSAVRELSTEHGYPAFNLAVRKRLRSVRQQPEFVRLIENVNLTETKGTTPYLFPRLVHREAPELGGEPYTPACEEIKRQILDDLTWLSEDMARDMPAAHPLKMALYGGRPKLDGLPGHDGYNIMTWGQHHYRVEWLLSYAMTWLEIPTSMFLLRELSQLRSLSIAGSHIEHMLKQKPQWWHSLGHLWPCLVNLAITPATDFDCYSRDKRWDSNFLIPLLIAAPNLRNLVAGGFYSNCSWRRGKGTEGEGEAEAEAEGEGDAVPSPSRPVQWDLPWQLSSMENLDLHAWGDGGARLISLEFIGCRIDPPWLSWFLSHAAVSGLKSFKYSDETYTPNSNALGVLRALHSSGGTRGQLEDLRLESYRGYQCSPRDAVKMKELLREFPRLQKVATNHKVLLPKSNGELGERSWEGVFGGRLQIIDTPRAKAQRKKVYVERLHNRWHAVVDGFRC